LGRGGSLEGRLAFVSPKHPSGFGIDQVGLHANRARDRLISRALAFGRIVSDPRQPHNGLEPFCRTRTPTAAITDHSGPGVLFYWEIFMRASSFGVVYLLVAVGFVFQRLRAPASISQSKWRRARAGAGPRYSG
jgi:hypothetical protein